MKACSHFQATLRRVGRDPETAISDELALHLDVCAHCRQLFDVTRVHLDPDDFEVLPQAARQRLLQSFAAGRAPRSRWRVPALAAAVAIVFLVVGVLYYRLEIEGRGKPIMAELVEDHIRYLYHPDLQADADAPTVKAYLEAHVDFPVELPKLPESRLAGARRWYLQGRRVALASYDTPAGPASYFILPAEGLKAAAGACPGDLSFSCAASHGYRIVSWEHAGLLHALVGPSEPVLLKMAKTCRGGEMH